MAVNSKAMAGVRAKRAGIILEMGLVRREANTFWVGSTTQRNIEFQVWRDDSGRVHCTCADFSELGANDHTFRCEHILAVKEYLDQKKQSEAEMKKNNIHVRAEEDLEAAHNKSDREQEKLDAEQQVPVSKPDFRQVLTKLSQPFPADDIKRRFGWSDQQGNAHYVDYVEWHTVADLLDQVYPSWSHSVKNVQQIGDFVAVTVAITIEGITREGVGTGAAFSEMGIKKAEHDALKRAAVKFGVARGLYKD